MATLPVYFEQRRVGTIDIDKHGPGFGSKRTLRTMLKDPRSTRGFRSTGQLEKGIGADRSTTERLLLSIGARKADGAEEWTLNPL
jgi:hypothetical protein